MTIAFKVPASPNQVIKPKNALWKVDDVVPDGKGYRQVIDQVLEVLADDVQVYIITFPSHSLF